MCKKLQLCVITLLLSVPALAAKHYTFGLSQAREPHRPYMFYTQTLRSYSTGPSAYTMATPYAGHLNKEVSAQIEKNELQQIFEKIRDSRFISDSRRKNFLRRSTWLFPDDGCFARADLARINTEKWTQISLNKIFVFGNLKAKSENSPDGEVLWWYHVAPIVKVNDDVYVIDPALNALHPMLATEWLHSMNNDDKELKVAICNGETYDPESNCINSDGEPSRALIDQQELLDEEWARQIQLGRNPEEVLGDNPPWAPGKTTQH